MESDKASPDEILDAIKTSGVTLASTIIGFIFEYLGINEANIITLYILGVLVIPLLLQTAGTVLFRLLSAF